MAKLPTYRSTGTVAILPGLLTLGVRPTTNKFEIRNPQSQQKRWRDAGWRSKDYVSVYAPLTLANAACDRHSSVDFGKMRIFAA